MTSSTQSKAASWLDQAPLFLDTETTGLENDDEIIELAIVDADGQVLFNSRIKPTVPVGEAARNVHGIQDEDLANAPSWPDVSDEVRSILENRHLVIFNARFDTRMIHQTAAAHGQTTEWLDECPTHCAMYLAADTYGATNRYGTISLANATARANVQWEGEAHTALADVQATIALVKTIAKAPELVHDEESSPSP